MSPRAAPPPVVVGWTAVPEPRSRHRLCRGVEDWRWLHAGLAHSAVRGSMLVVWPSRAAALDAARAMGATNPRARRVVRRG